MTDMDKLARERISTEIDTNFFVEAGAGSGKTTQLVQRMTAMVRAGIPVGTISAITFTKAAAREFYQRFQKELIRLSTDEKVELAERVKCAEALRDIDLCFMGTIDSFSHLILHEHPVEGGIPSDSAVKSENEMRAVYRREYSAILRREYGDELFGKYERFRSVQNRPSEVFAAFIPKIIEARASRFIFEMPDDTDIESIFSNEITAVRNALRCLYSHPEAISEGTGDCRESKDLLMQKYDMLSRAWNSNIDNVCYVLGKLDGLRLTCSPSEIGVLDESLFEYYDGKRVQYYSFKIKDTDLFRELKELRYSFTMDFLVSAARAIAEKLRKNGELTFFDYKLYLRDMLKKDAENGGKLIRHIFERHSYFLIDEFQDTDPMQAEIFFYLTAEEPVANWRKCVPRKGSLFIVGDPKQSIYRFRSADVSAFKEVRQLFENGVGEVVQLTRNFRSTAKLRNWFNDTFKRLLPEDTHHQSRFSPIPIEDTDDSSLIGGVWTYNVEMKRNSIVDDEIQVAKIICGLVSDKDKLIKSSNDAPAQNVRYSDFMVIVNSKNHIIKFLREFERCNIPVMVEGKISFGDCPALCAIVPIMEAAADPYNKTTVYAALTGDVFNIRDSELIKLRNSGGSLVLFRSKEGEALDCEEIETAKDKLAKLAVRARTMTPAALFCAAMDELRIIEKTGAAYLEYLYYALELLRSAEVQGEVVSVRDGAAFLRDLLDESAQERCISLQRDSGRVHIANLHKVKGLEAPVVILADPRTTAHSPDRRTEHNADGSDCYIFSLSSETLKAAETERYPAAFIDEEESMTAEKLRLLYVAATRARNLLIISNAVKSSGEPANGNPWEPLLYDTDGDIFSLINQADDTDMAQRTETNAAELYDEAEKTSLFNETEPGKPTYAIVRPSQIKLKSVIDSEDDFEDNADAEMRAKEIRTNAALVGTMVHRLIECLVSAKSRTDPGKLAAEIVGKYNASDEYVDMLKKVYECMNGGGYPQSNDIGSDLLAELREAEEVHCEVPFCHRAEEADGTFTLWNGVIDLLYKKDGKWHIIDYKTNAEANSLDHKYEDQLSAYKAAVLAITGEESEAAIYHIDV